MSAGKPIKELSITLSGDALKRVIFRELSASIGNKGHFADTAAKFGELTLDDLAALDRSDTKIEDVRFTVRIVKDEGLPF